MTLQAGIFGYPIGHSISPAMHNAAFKHHGIDAVYEAWETAPEDLGVGVAALRSEDYLGANVTVPHKQAVMEHLDEIDELAARIGAVNTIVNQSGRLTGFNTDALGFISSLRGEAGVNVSGLKVVLIGAGGAARAAAYALADARAGELTIGNRTVERAEIAGDRTAGSRDGGGLIRYLGPRLSVSLQAGRPDSQLHLGRYAARTRGGNFTNPRGSAISPDASFTTWFTIRRKPPFSLMPRERERRSLAVFRCSSIRGRQHGRAGQAGRRRWM